MTNQTNQAQQGTVQRQSNAVSAKYPTGCDTCGAGIGEPCRSTTSGKVTDTHRARIDASYPRAL